MESSYGWLSLLPPLAAVTAAIVTRRPLLSLLGGVLLGSFIFCGGAPFAALEDALRVRLYGNLFGPFDRRHPWAFLCTDHLQVFAFTLLMGAMVGVVHRIGGMHGIVDRLMPIARGRRGGQLITWLLGLIIFFDDYANTLLLGGTMQLSCDRLRISREKLAYLVDSTAAPVAGLSLVSTWVAGELGFIGEGLKKLPAGAAPLPEELNAFIASIPYRFYVLWALALVFLIGWLGRDFGPMLRAERKMLDEPPEDETGLARDAPSTGRPKTSLPAPRPTTPRRAINAVLPIGIVIGVLMYVLIQTGMAATADIPIEARTWMAIFNSGDSYAALVWASLAGWTSACLLGGLQRLADLAELAWASLRGAWLMMPALMILWAAWSLSSLTGRDALQTGEYLAGCLEGQLPLCWMPSLTFLIAAFLSFSTGTSWGTMGILMPLTIPVVYNMAAVQLGGPIDPCGPVMAASVGGVLAGAIFGDHCSPISDTTVLSAQASGCDLIAHVRTQMPYALVTAGVSVLLGTLPVGLGLPVGWAWLSGTIALVVIVWIFGRRCG